MMGIRSGQNPGAMGIGTRQAAGFGAGQGRRAGIRACRGRPGSSCALCRRPWEVAIRQHASIASMHREALREGRPARASAPGMHFCVQRADARGRVSLAAVGGSGEARTA